MPAKLARLFRAHQGYPYANIAGYIFGSRCYSIFKSLVTRSYAEGRAIARRGEGDKVTDDLELKLRVFQMKRTVVTPLFYHGEN